MFLKPTKKLLYNFFPAKKLALFVLLFLFLFAKPFLTVAAPSDVLTGPSGNKYVQVGTQQFPVTDKGDQYPGGRYWSDLGGACPGCLVGGSSFDIAAGEILAKQERGGDNGPGAVVGQTASAVKDAAVSAFVKLVMQVVIGVLSIIAYFCKDLVYYAAQTLDLALNPTLYSGLASNTMVVKGWIVVRDVCNLFFLLVLIFIAICTILKIEKYHAKKTLLMLIIMALLINFSKPITVFIFDGSQLLMNFFLNQMGTTGTGKETASSLITKSTDIANLVYKTLPKNEGTPEIAVQYLFAVVFLFMLAVAYVVTALMLIIRIIAVMVLTIVSPLAFFAAIVPDFSKMSSQWWSSLFEYSYYGPAAAFFLLLATQLQNNLPQIKPTANGQSLDATVTNIIHYLTVLVFLYASIIMAKKFGGGAGAAIVGNANRFMKGAARMGGTGLLAAGTLGQYWRARDAAKGTLQGISQRSGMGWLTKAGREKTSKERQERAAERFAPFNIANAKKKSEEMKNDDIAKVNAGVAKGDAASILQAASRGKLTAAQLANPKVRALMKKYADFEGSVYKNLRDTGNGHVQYADMVNRGSTTAEAFEKTYKDLSFNNMAEKGSLKQALVTENASGGADDIFQKMDKLKDTTAINNLKARASNGETFNVLQKLHDYRVWENSVPPFSSPPPLGFIGPPTPANLKAYLMA